MNSLNNNNSSSTSNNGGSSSPTILTTKPQLITGSSTGTTSQTIKSLLTNSSMNNNASNQPSTIISIHSAPANLSTSSGCGVVQQAVPININSSLSQVLRQFSATSSNIQTISTASLQQQQQPSAVTQPITETNEQPLTGSVSSDQKQ